MPRWLVVVAVATLTWLLLTAHERGVTDAVVQRAGEVEIEDWETAAEYQGTERRAEDGFQRAWNKSEVRVHDAMARETPAPRRR